MRLKRLFAAIMAAAMLLLVGCDDAVAVIGQPEQLVTEEQSAPLYEVVLPYDKDEGFDIVTTTSRYNLDIASLIYLPLVGLDGNFTPSGGLAESVTVDGVNVKISLKEPLAASVVEILERIRVEGGSYGARLADVALITQVDNYNLSITLNGPNANFAPLLNIPMPFTKGAYSIEGEWLVSNVNAPLDRIKLLDTEGDEAAGTFYRSGELSAVTGVTGCYGASFPTTNLVYIGTNIEDNMIRVAISAALNRTAIIDDNHSSQGYTALSPIHPDHLHYDETAVERGYDPVFASSVFAVTMPEGDAPPPDSADYVEPLPDFKLIVSAAGSEKLTVAQSVAYQLRAVGIDVEVVSLSSAEFERALTTGDFDMYIGEVKLSPDLDITPLVATGGYLNFGGISIPELDQALANYKGSGEASDMSTVMTVLDSTFPIIPLYYIMQDTAAHTDLLPHIEPTFYAPYNGIENYAPPR